LGESKKDMTEAQIQSKFSAYISQHLPNETIAWELKFVDLGKHKSKPFNCVYPQQIKSLLEVEGKGLYWKIPDTAAISGFTSPKPCDCIFMKGKGYMVVCFYVPRKRKTCYLIRIHDWIGMEKNADRKSFTENMAAIAAEEVIEL
jgi:hypothetical protein